MRVLEFASQDAQIVREIRCYAAAGKWRSRTGTRLGEKGLVLTAESTADVWGTGLRPVRTELACRMNRNRTRKARMRRIAADPERSRSRANLGRCPRLCCDGPSGHLRIVSGQGARGSRHCPRSGTIRAERSWEEILSYEGRRAAWPSTNKIRVCAGRGHWRSGSFSLGGRAC